MDWMVGIDFVCLQYLDLAALLTDLRRLKGMVHVVGITPTEAIVLIWTAPFT
jgi:hypothetical protein